MAEDSSLFRKIIKPLSALVPFSKENDVSSKEFDKKAEVLELGGKVLDEWNRNESVYSQLISRMTESRGIYVGDTQYQWGQSPEGELQLVFNVSATIIDLFCYILSNNAPVVQFVPEGADDLAQVKADFGETLVRKLLTDAKFHKRFKDSVKDQFLLGFCLMYPLWNSENEDGGEKGTFEVSKLNPFTTRVRFATDDYDKILSFITHKRMLPQEIEEKYGYQGALPDSEDVFLPETIEKVDDGMVTVFRRYDDKEIVTVINGRSVKVESHDLGFVPLEIVNNIIVPNDAHGHPESSRWTEVIQEINALISIASEIARDLGYPTLLEINNALGGRKVGKWRGQKVPVRVSDKGEGIRYLINPAQIAPLLNQIKLLLDLFHFISLMPKAAAGVFEPSITSGFQAKLAMQPATLTTENRKIDWELAIKNIVKKAIKMLEKYNPKALQIDLPNGKKFKFEGLAEHEMKIIWPDNLPIDIAREIQNLVLGIQNNLTSAHQAIDRYNALLDIGSPTDTLDYLEQEAEDANINPDRALKVAEVKVKLQGLMGVLGQANEGLTDLRGQLNQDEIVNNPNNLAAGAASPLPEEQRVTSASAEGVPTESTGGVAIPPK